MLAFLVLLAHYVIAVPDSSTQVTCNGPLRVVTVNSILGVVCTVQAKFEGAIVSVPFSSFGFSVTGGNGNTVNQNPSGTNPASQFTFQIEVGGTTGLFALTNAIGAPTINFTVVTAPSQLTTMSCPPRQRANETCNCTVIPRDTSGNAVWVEANKFTFSGLDKNNLQMKWSAPYPSIGNKFLVQGTFPASSIFTVNNGLTTNGVKVAALDDPDSTSVIKCEPTVIPANTITVCSIEPKKASASITVLQTLFHLSGLNQGTAYSAITPDDMQLSGVGSHFTFTATAGSEMQARPFANTGLFNLTDGISTPFPVTVIADPDQTSTLTCESSQVVEGGVLSCTSIPNLVGKNVFAQTSVWQLSVDDKSGSSGDSVAKFSAISPAIAGNVFHWTVSPNDNLLGSASMAEIIVNDGKSPQFTINVTAPVVPDMTSSISCSSTVMRPSQQIFCMITPKSANMAVASKASAFTLTDTQGGTFSTLTPKAGKSLNFTYTAKSTASGSVTISNGVGSKLVITVSGTAPTAPVPTAPSVPTAPTARPPTPISTPESGGGIGAGGVVAIVIVVIAVAAGIFLGWSYKKKRDAAKVSPLDSNTYAYSPPVIN